MFLMMKLKFMSLIEKVTPRRKKLCSGLG